MIKNGKEWGETIEFFNNGLISAHHIHINKDGFCSEHCHYKKTNLFYVVSGELEITKWTPSGTKDRTVLQAGQATTILLKIWHKFRALTDVECIEIYEVLLDPADIDRRTEGGKK